MWVTEVHGLREAPLVHVHLVKSIGLVAKLREVCRRRVSWLAVRSCHLRCALQSVPGDVIIQEVITLLHLV
jgi:hypothetical protein